jgi:hypothetical protein
MHTFFSFVGGTGEFAMGEMHGEGVLTFRNYDRYEGQMMRNRMHGRAGCYRCHEFC